MSALSVTRESAPAALPNVPDLASRFAISRFRSCDLSAKPLNEFRMDDSTQFRLRVRLFQPREDCVDLRFVLVWDIGNPDRVVASDYRQDLVVQGRKPFLERSPTC